MNRLHIVGLGVALIACNPSAMAREIDGIFPGASCQPSSTTDRISRNSTGAMFNESSGDNQDWTCPIARNTNAAGSIEFAQIVIIDNSSNSDVTCTLYSSSSDGDVVDTVKRTTSGHSDEPQTLKFGSGDANAVSSVAGGMYYFRCRIPRQDDGDNSGVVSYRILENVGEN